MKNKVLSLLVMFFLAGTVSVFAQSKSEEFKVYGNCGMCEDRIENAAKSVDGVTKASWDSETEVLKITFDEAKTATVKIHEAVAKVEHDTDLKKADDKVYNNLHGCCQYDRPKKKK